MKAGAEGGLRVLHFVDSLRLGGKERQVVELVKGLSRVEQVGRVDQKVVSMGTEDFYVGDLEQAGVELEYLLRRWRWDVGVFSRFEKILRAYRPSVIHTNSTMNTIYAMWGAKRLGIPLINGSIRNAFGEGGWRWRMERWVLARSDARLANSMAGLKSRKFVPEGRGNYVVYNGFDAGRFRGLNGVQEIDEEWFEKSRGKKRVIMVAEFSSYKDYPTYLKAAEVILGRRDDVVFLTVGNGVEWERSQAMVNRSGDGIFFLGARKDVERILASVDVGVLCTFTEGIPNAVMEYMASGKPVVVTDGGGSGELVAEGETGFLVLPGDLDRVVEKIEYLLDHPEEGLRMGRKGQEKLESEFSLDQLARNTLAAYREVIRVRHKNR